MIIKIEEIENKKGKVKTTIKGTRVDLMAGLTILVESLSEYMTRGEIELAVECAFAKDEKEKEEMANKKMPAIIADLMEKYAEDMKDDKEGNKND